MSGLDESDKPLGEQEYRIGREAENDKEVKGKGDDEGDEGNATQSRHRHPSRLTPSPPMLPRPGHLMP
jgi:hypothetical protein